MKVLTETIFSFIFSPTAVCYAVHPLLAVVSHSLWKKDCSLCWKLGKTHSPCFNATLDLGELA